MCTISLWFDLALLLIIPISVHGLLISFTASGVSRAQALKPAQPLPQFAQSREGMAATGAPESTAAAIRILDAGGNAIDAAIAAYFAIAVVDPANTSIAGRAQILLHSIDGRTIAIDGATEAPSGVRPLSGADDDRQGFRVVPVPGALAATAEMSRLYGRLKWPELLAPAIELAEKGFAVTPRLAATWERTRDALANDPGAARHFLKPDGTAWKEGEIFRQPQLAATLRRIAVRGAAEIYRGSIAKTIVRDMSAAGGYVQLSDLHAYRTQPAPVIWVDYRGHRIATAGGRAWGNTLAQMLNILSHFDQSGAEPTAEQAEVMARVIAQALADRPQQLGTLRPKPDGAPLSRISSPEFAAERAEMIKRAMQQNNSPPGSHQNDGDTTHLSVMDREGNAVAFTTSIGPSFGSRAASAELGFLYAHSYNMRSSPTPRQRDHTEMTPTIVFKNNRAALAVGAAGSERIPVGIVQVISNIIDRGMPLERAISAPRIHCTNLLLRVHDWMPAETVDALAARGFTVERRQRDAAQHLGLVQAVQYDPAEGVYYGAADPSGDGRAGSPQNTMRNPQKQPERTRRGSGR
ncbi:MAG: gamma-glutamyltransferase [Blastocatellales bacterium]|nr:gamma-glutamyltransferase [Blastocatellales bacterium]